MAHTRQTELRIDKIKSDREFASTWNTHRNEEYGFEFRYPKTAIVEENIKEASIDVFVPVQLVPAHGDNSSSTLRAIQIFPVKSKTYVKDIFSIKIDEFSLSKEHFETSENFYIPRIVTDYKSISVGDRTGAAISYSEFQPVRHIVLDNDDDTYFIATNFLIYQSVDSTQIEYLISLEEVQSTFLSTLRFTK